MLSISAGSYSGPQQTDVGVERTCTVGGSVILPRQQLLIQLLSRYFRDDVHSFVQKQISRDLLKVDFMYDDEIAKFREELRLWMGKMGVGHRSFFFIGMLLNFDQYLFERFKQTYLSMIRLRQLSVRG